ncbi:hypothetical protein C8F01DRAFT_1187765 [Mycena amicta]|nr:hypothetical protein C8F01DRAFT_1187765 [Mycena amicta]
MFRTMTDVDQRMILLQRIIDDAVDRKRPALTWAGLYLAFACKSNFQQKKLFALRRIADVFVAEDKDDESALAVSFTAMEVFCARGECLVRIGDIQKRRGRMGDARSAWEAAVEPFEKSLQRKQVAECKERLLALENSTRVADRLILLVLDVLFCSGGYWLLRLGFP